jgi:flavodoxin I
MEKIGLIYSFQSRKTKHVAQKIAEEFEAGQIEQVDASTITAETFLSFEKLILGVPTWFDGELPHYWDEFVPELETLDLTGKKVALFGLGDQKGYPENFVDGIGLMANIIRKCGGEIIGETSAEGYTFESSAALEDGKFLGLAIDQENQARLTNDRVKKWITELKVKFK